MTPLRARVSATLLALIAIFSIVSAPVAVAAPARWDSIEVRLIQGQDGSPVTIVTGILPASANLPAEVSLSVPTGTQPDWVGEVLGGDLSQDPTVVYKRTPKTGYDELAFTLTKARTGQVEYADPNAKKASGKDTETTVSWTSSVDVDQVTLAAQLPSGATVTSSDGASADSSAGGNVYSKTFNSVKAGKPLSIVIVYSGGTSTGTPPPPGSPSTAVPSAPAATATGGLSPVPFILGAALVLGLIYLYAQRHKNADGDGSASGEPSDSEPFDTD